MQKSQNTLNEMHRTALVIKLDEFSLWNYQAA